MDCTPTPRADDVSIDPSTCRTADEESSSLARNQRWLCVRTQPRKELFAAKNLEMQSYRHYLPTLMKTVRHARKVTKVRAALFPTYLFVEIDLDVQQWRPIRSTFGVSNLIMENDRPKLVPSGVVETLQEATNDDGHIDFRHDVQIGQNVRLLSGPFFNLVGTLEALDDRGRVAVLLDILGGQRRVFAEQTALQPIES